MAKAKTNSTPSFEEALQSLEYIVHNMETGQLSLDEALKAYEQGVQLTRICQEALAHADQRVRVLHPDDTETSLMALPEGQ